MTSINNLPTISTLRDRLLQEAQQERQRCLEVAEAANPKRSADVNTQTDPVAFASDVHTPAPASFATRSLGSLNLDTTYHVPCSLADEDEEQMEAIRALTKLGELGEQTELEKTKVFSLSEQVEKERQEREAVNKDLAVQLSQKEARNEQVLCLENELDRREIALENAERALDRRNAELQQALLRIRELEEGACTAISPVSETMIMESQCRGLRGLVNEKEHELEMKDRYITQLLALLRNRGVYLEEDTCARSVVPFSERSLPLHGAGSMFTASTAASSFNGLY